MANELFDTNEHMEEETKHRIPDKETSEAIWKEVLAGDYGKVISSDTVVMKAVYFDTENRILKQNGIAMRVRCEGSNCFATLKWGSKESDQEGLNRHHEINVPVDGDTCFIAPPSNLFEQSIDGQNMETLIGSSTLVNLFETRVLRKRATLEKDKTIVELAIDEGLIVTDNAEEAISEMEVELMVGSISTTIDIANTIADKYDLQIEPKTKYARAIALLEK